MNKWDIRFLKLAREVSTWSKDPSTKIGAVIVNDDKRVLSTGYNGFPKGIDDSKERLNDRELKYQFVVHAEMNAIYNATRSGVALKDGTLYCWGLPVCSKCSLGVISAGIKRVVMVRKEIPERWEKETKISLDNFNEAGICTSFVDIKEFENNEEKH